MKSGFLSLLAISFFLYSCTVFKQINKSAKQDVINAPALQTAHTGICIYEPATGKYWYNYQGNKYFVPASNTKLATCYAAMKYLGDSLVGLRYGVPEEKWYKEHTVILQASGDPTFLHSDYKNQPVFNFLLKNIFQEKREPVFLINASENIERWGNGWSWNDYDADYMAERNSFPIFGNVLNIRLNDSTNWLGEEVYPEVYKSNLFKTQSHYFDSIINDAIRTKTKNNILSNQSTMIEIKRNISSNQFWITPSKSRFSSLIMPFVTYGSSTTLNVLSDTLKQRFSFLDSTNEKDKYVYLREDCDIGTVHINKWIVIHSQPTDSLLKPMMHRSDNFFAEQSLLMVSNELLGVMNDARIIDTLLKTDYKDLPQKPRWVDGSGLSRYNLFSPQDFVFILNKIRGDFGMERMKNILATGGTGTLSNYYKADAGYIFAKTGTLSGVVSISGFIYTKKNKLLIFSVLVNNHNSSATEVRKAVEKFIEGVRNKY